MARIAVLEKAFTALEALGELARPASLKELADLTRLPKPTLFRVLQTLGEMGYVSQDGARGDYLLGARLLQLTRNAASDDIRQQALPAMEALHQLFNETVNLGVRRASRSTTCTSSRRRRTCAGRSAPAAGTRSTARLWAARSSRPCRPSGARRSSTATATSRAPTARPRRARPSPPPSRRPPPAAGRRTSRRTTRAFAASACRCSSTARRSPASASRCPPAASPTTPASGSSTPCSPSATARSRFRKEEPIAS